MKYTIIITIYNKEKYLKRAIISACTQNYDKYEVIVVNDGSNDNSDKEINKLLKIYNFKYYKKENSGVSDTRNYAIEKVNTPYFLFLDADDYLEKDLLKEIDNYNDYDILSFNSTNKDINNNIIEYIKKPVHNGSGEEFIKKILIDKVVYTVPWGYVYNKEYFNKNKYQYPKGEILEDFYLTPFILADAKKVISIDFNGYNYITNDNSIINNKNNNKRITNTYIKHYKNMLQRINKSNYSISLKNSLKDFISGAIIWYGSTLKNKEQKDYIKIVKQLKVTNNLNKNIMKKLIIKICYKLNIYYPVRKVYVKLFINNKITNIINNQLLFYGPKEICLQLAYILNITNPIIINKNELKNINNKNILLCENTKKYNNNKYIKLNKIYKLINKDYLKSFKSQDSYKSKIKRFLIVLRPSIRSIKLINKIPVKLLKPSEMLIKTLNAKSVNIECNKLENTCYIDKYGDVYGCCPGWAIWPFGNILKNNYYDNYISRIIKLSSINKTYCFCDLTKCKHKSCNNQKVNLNNIKRNIYPKEVTIAYDQSCNLKCLSCRKNYYHAKDNDLERINNITKKILESNWLEYSNIVLAGQGEVFFSKAYKELLKSNIKRNNINILSNGTLFNKKNFDMIKGKYKNITVSISIDAATPNTYKKLRCGNFLILSNNLEMLSKERKNGNIQKLQFNYVVQKENYKEMESFVKLAKKLHADTVQFTKLGDWGTYTKEEYIENRLILENNILVYDLYKEFQKNIFKDKIVDIDSFKENIELSNKYYGGKHE